jgi:radical SAM superfamily enzyme YgiQ (UPF0313 family)
MNILLISPPFKKFTGLINNYFPVGLASLAAVVKRAGYAVKIYEADAVAKTTGLDFAHEYQQYGNYLQAVNAPEHPAWDEVRQLVKNYRPDLVGISSMTHQIASALRVAEICKAWNHDCRVVLGGPHPTVSPEQTLAHPAVDMVIRGEGETVFLALVKALEANQPDLGHIPSLSYKDRGGIQQNPLGEVVSDLDALPFAARGELMHIDNYSSEDMGLILTSRGCPFRCTYCYHPWKGKMYFRTIDNVMEEIARVRRDYGTRQFTIKDDTLTVKRHHVVEFCEQLIKRKMKINWDCTTRVDRIDEDLLKLMIRSGCNTVKIGVETGSQKILKEIQKGITLDQVRQAARLFKKHSLFWSCYFMIGLPQETEEDISQSYRFLKELNPHYASLGLYTPFRFTKLFEQGVEYGLLYPEVELQHFFQTSPKDYYFIDPKKRTLYISPERFEKLFQQMTDAFHKHNIGFSRLARRGWARKRQYLTDPRLFWGDCQKALHWALHI